MVVRCAIWKCLCAVAAVGDMLVQDSLHHSYAGAEDNMMPFVPSRNPFVCARDGILPVCRSVERFSA
jgi:hypothetical protein